LHTLAVPEEAIVWVAFFSGNINVDDEGNVISILDSKTILKGYRALCELAEVNCDRVIVHGE
jgi:hypothetical protein